MCVRVAEVGCVCVHEFNARRGQKRASVTGGWPNVGDEKNLSPLPKHLKLWGHHPSLCTYLLPHPPSPWPPWPIAFLSSNGPCFCFPTSHTPLLSTHLPITNHCLYITKHFKVCTRECAVPCWLLRAEHMWRVCWPPVRNENNRNIYCPSTLGALPLCLREFILSYDIPKTLTEVSILQTPQILYLQV